MRLLPLLLSEEAMAGVGVEREGEREVEGVEGKEPLRDARV